MTPRQQGLLDRVIVELEREAVNTPTPQLIAQSLGIPRQAVEEILRLGVVAGQVVQVESVVFYTPRQVDVLKGRITAFADGHPFTSNALRDHLATTRKYVLPLLDYLDSIGLTQKTGSERTIIGSTPI